jgi:hypothetical protein
MLTKTQKNRLFEDTSKAVLEDPRTEGRTELGLLCHAFARLGAETLRKQYGIDAKPVTGAMLFMYPDGGSYTFGEPTPGGDLVATEASCHSLIWTPDMLIDLTAGHFPPEVFGGKSKPIFERHTSQHRRLVFMPDERLTHHFHPNLEKSPR